MFRVGAHVSISGGFSNAVSREIDFGGNCGQIFVGSPRGWKVNKPDDVSVDRFKKLSSEENIGPWVVHGTYLINMATPKESLAEKSMECMQREIISTSKLGIPFYVFHPGAHTGSGVDVGIENIAKRLSRLEIPDSVTVLLENTAGKGTTIGKNFSELSRIVELSDYSYGSLGVCLDTCHMYAAGYQFGTEESIEGLVREFDKKIGFQNLHYLHINDSKYDFSSEKDEHEHIGEGKIGDKAFRLFINHRKFRDKPMVVETPVDEKGFSWNIDKLKSLRN